VEPTPEPVARAHGAQEQRHGSPRQRSISGEAPLTPDEGDGDVSQGQYGQGERTLSQAAGMVADAKRDFDSAAKKLDGQIQGLRSQWVGQGGTAFFLLHQAWTERQQIIVNALNEFEASLLSTERDNIGTDETQSSAFHGYSARLG
jgi:WXG100 family type VII secretion target